MTGCTVIFLFLFALLNGYIALEQIFTKTMRSGVFVCVYGDTALIKVRQFLLAQIPLIILIPSNATIIIKILMQRRKWKKMTNQQKNNERKSFKLTVMVLSVTGCYIVLALPFSIFLLCCFSKENRSAYEKIRIGLTILPFINATINGYLYFLSSEMYRKEVKKTLIKWAQFFGCFKGRVEPMGEASKSVKSSTSETTKSKIITKTTDLSGKSQVFQLSTISG